jgi:hypothetical protein
MRKRIHLLGAIAVAAVLVTANPASAQYDGHYIWSTAYYTDASMTTWAGGLRWVACHDDQASYRLIGTQTAYYDITGPDGECGDELHPNT